MGILKEIDRKSTLVYKLVYPSGIKGTEKHSYDYSFTENFVVSVMDKTIFHIFKILLFVNNIYFGSNSFSIFSCLGIFTDYDPKLDNLRKICSLWNLRKIIYTYTILWCILILYFSGSNFKMTKRGKMQ